MKHTAPLACLCMLTSACLLSNDGREDNMLVRPDAGPRPDASQMPDMMVGDTPQDLDPVVVDMAMDMPPTQEDMAPDTPPDMPPEEDMPPDMPVEEDMPPDMPSVMPCGGTCAAPNGCQVDDQGVGTCVAAPKTCEEALAARTLPGAGAVNDDFATLYFSNDPARPWFARCHRQTANDDYREYLATDWGPGGGGDTSNNTAVDYAAGVRTVYDAYRVDPITLIVDGSDTTYAYTETLGDITVSIPPHRPSEVVNYVPAGMVRGCGVGAMPGMGPPPMNTKLYRAVTQFDISSTGLKIKSDFVEHGLCAMPGNATVVFNPERTWVTLTFDPNTREQGCGGLAPTQMANKYEARCMNMVTRLTDNPMPSDFRIVLEHAGQ